MVMETRKEARNEKESCPFIPFLYIKVDSYPLGTYWHDNDIPGFLRHHRQKRG
jgi:hypothetical protein